MLKLILFIFAIAFVLQAVPAGAYVGPGAGLTMLGALWAVIAAVALVLVGIIIWPVRLYLRRRKAAAEAKSTDD
jgi:hypothetical protein